MTFEEEANSLIGLPYDAFNAHCWDLVSTLIPNAPRPQGTAKTLTSSVKHFKKELNAYNLQEVDNYRNKDIIILGKGDIFFHAGVFYNNGVIHASLYGVVYQDMSTIKKLYPNIKGLRVWLLLKQTY